GSNGYFMFNILLKENLPLGTLTQNRAGIYFDYNKPIITNYATTVLALRVNNEEELSSEIEIFPNPSTGIFQVLQKNIQIRSIHVHNLLGQRVKENVQMSQGKIDLSDLDSGIYFLEIDANEGVLQKKILKK
ncbi:MAG: T9SS type A sorting domain-containing protein, partial [Bacteroidota bacterium]